MLSRMISMSNQVLKIKREANQSLLILHSLQNMISWHVNLLAPRRKLDSLIGLAIKWKRIGWMKAIWCSKQILIWIYTIYVSVRGDKLDLGIGLSSIRKGSSSQMQILLKYLVTATNLKFPLRFWVMILAKETNRLCLPHFSKILILKLL